ncbi:MAG: ParB/RepB/Spo0J family partition protein [Pirellulaceae bacterium]|nr:ParB/RepB/Spo0J family partition protein [Pirellulaceae bacterium]
MASTKRRISELENNLDESMGRRASNSNISVVPQFSPVPSPKDIGRVPVRGFGEVQLEQVIVDPGQPRVEFNADEIERLAHSIREKGQLQPIRVRWDAQHEKWAIIAGERRFRASQVAGLSSIQCYFHEGQISESEILEQQLIENLLREDLKPIEEARAYAALMELNDWNGKQVATALRLSPSRVSRGLALLDLPVAMQKQIETGQLGKTAAYELSKLKDEDMLERVAADSAESAVTTRQATSLVNQRRGKRKAPSATSSQTFAGENGIRVVVTYRKQQNYHDLLEALEAVVEEVRLRIDNNVHLT